MYDENQIVHTRWSGNNKAWYQSKGYVFTKHGDDLYVKAKDLSPGCAKKIKAVCDYCSNEYEAQFDLITAGRKKLDKDCCHRCTGKKASEISRAKRIAKYFPMLRNVCEQYGYKLVTQESDYTDLNMQIQYICPKHGLMSGKADNLLRGHGCLKCSYETRFDTMKLSAEQVANTIASIKENTLLNPDEYINCVTNNLRIRCRCGNEYTTSYVNFLRHGVNQCPKCSNKESKGEELIRVALDDLGVSFEREKRFDDCRDVKPLPFDFFLPDYNMCIEFDGQHHYEDIEEYSDLETVIAHDEIKNNYCAKNDIRLLRIPYYEGNYILEIIKKELDV